VSVSDPGIRSRDREAVRLSQLAKTWKGPAGPIQAVRGIDVSIPAGETVALLGPNGAGKSTTIDMILGLARPDGGAVSVLGLAPREAVSRGLVGAMLQTGALIRDLSVRELISMSASLYPAPMNVDDVIAWQGSARPRSSAHRSFPEARRSACGLRWRS